MLRFKVWLLNLNKVSEMDGTTFGKYMHDTFPGGALSYEFYKVFDDNPENHMLYSIAYLNRASVLKLLWKHYEWQGFFRRMYINERW